jgi:hypothetical protein
MNSVHLLTIGYVPNDCNSDRIVCGDPQESGTKEVSLRIEEKRMIKPLRLILANSLMKKASYGSK